MDKQAQWDIETLQKTIGVIPYEEMERDAIERAIKALEKQIAKKPIKDKEQNIRYTSSYSCPTCGGGFSGTGIADYCYHCGQKLEWDIEG